MIDRKSLPRVALIDTPVIIRAVLKDRQDEGVTPVCRAFVEAMLESKRTLLISTPSLAEVIRGRPAVEVPSVKGIETVSFDRRTAMVLGRTFPADKLKQLAKVEKMDREVIYFDTMIVACAIRHQAEAVVTLDKGRMMKSLGEHCPIPICAPGDYKLPLLIAIDQAKEDQEEAGTVSRVQQRSARTGESPE